MASKGKVAMQLAPPSLHHEEPMKHNKNKQPKGQPSVTETEQLESSLSLRTDYWIVHYFLIFLLNCHNTEPSQL